MQRLEETQCRDRLSYRGACTEDGRSLRNAHLLAVDLDLHVCAGGALAVDRVETLCDCGPGLDGGHRYTPSLRIALSIAPYAVCPNPQIDASFIAAPTSSSSAISSCTFPSVF